MLPRSSRVALTINGRSADIKPEAFTFHDIASGSSDSISIQLGDRDRKWIHGWFPQKGDYIKATIITDNWDKEGRTEENFCGTFYVDDFSFQGGPITLTMDAVSYPAISGFKGTERTKTYEKTTLAAIGSDVASRNKIQLSYNGPNVGIEKVTQDNQTDAAFFNDLCKKYGLSLKVFNNRLVVSDESIYESQGPVATLTERDIEPGWKFNSTVDGVYTGVKFQYTNSEKNESYTIMVGSEGKVMNLNLQASNLGEATTIALASINDANKKNTTMTCTLVHADRRIMATKCVQISGLGNIDGKYFVEECSHSIGSGYKQQLTLRKVQQRLTQPTSAKNSGNSANPAASDSSPSYSTVRYGSRGSTVKVMQQKLQALGYSLPRYGSDGIFGSETRSAVMAFQKANGLTVDGICGPQTWAKLTGG